MVIAGLGTQVRERIESFSFASIVLTTIRSKGENFASNSSALPSVVAHDRLGGSSVRILRTRKAVETPQPNLVEGMHWLESTFATRFNRFRSERGHVFQGRYQGAGGRG